jgi:hypothetical protein
MTRGILYIVWGDKIESQLQRSIESVKKIYPGMPTHVERVENLAERGLLQKAKMASVSPFESTLYLDADTVVLGNLDYAFDRAEEFGLACSICECPWTRRYGEYNTGVIFFTQKSRAVFDAWESLAPTVPASGRWAVAIEGKIYGSAHDDQASFARAIQSCRLNPYVLPLNYNFRPPFQKSFFSPMKIWHSPYPVPETIERISSATEAGQVPVTHIAVEWRANKP